MNYVGSISILDRGDAPAQAVIDRNARSLAKRIANETKEELEKVLTRVETIYNSFEDSDHLHGSSNLEYLQDIAELEELMKDQVKKKKYQHQVTIFIVGFSDVCGQKLRLMQQVNEFFTENSKKIEKEDWFPTTPDLDLDEVGGKIEESLQAARDLGKHLGDLNKEMVEYMAGFAEKKASSRGKKKMEKALGQARDEVQALADKLQAAQTELDEKDEKLQATFKQLEMKNLEVQKFRTAAELAKKSVQDSQAFQEQIRSRDAKIAEQRQLLNRMEVDLAQSSHSTERSQTQLAAMVEESQQKITLLHKELEDQRQAADDTKRDLSKFHEEELKALKQSHQQNMDEVKKQHAEQIKTLTSEGERARRELAEAENCLHQLQEQGAPDTPSDVVKHFDLEPDEVSSRQSSKQESRPSTKVKKGSKSSAKYPAGKDGKGNKSSSASSGKEFADSSIQDEGGDPATALVDKVPGTRHSRRSRSTLAPLDELEGFEDAFDLTDEHSWSTVPKDQLESRFAQYRRLCLVRLREVEEDRQLTVAKTQRKVQLLKSQFVEHKSKWEAERKLLIQQVEQAQQLQTDAEKEADLAMTQLEEFITEQEKLEVEEETRRSVLLQSRSHSSILSQVPATPQPPAATAGAATQADGHQGQQPDDLQRLMQQTDDAKVEELKGRLTGTKSAPPEVSMVGSEVRGEGSTFRETSIIESEKGRKDSRDSQAITSNDLQDSSKTQDDRELDVSKAVNQERSLSQDGSLVEKGNTDVTLDSMSETQVIEQVEELQQLDGISEYQTASETIQKQTPEVIVSGKTEEELREASARSRASLRNQYRHQLSESRQAAEERRTKTPQITVPTKLSVDDELVFEEDEEEEEDDFDQMVLPDDVKEEIEEQKKRGAYEIGTSPPPVPHKTSSTFSSPMVSRKSSTLKEHPLLKEYLKVYDGVTDFKENLSKLFLDKDMMSASQILADLEVMSLNKEEKVMPQVEDLTVNALYILEEISSVISSAVMVDREPVVSSLLPFSRDETRPRMPTTREPSTSEDTSHAYTHPKQVTPASAAGTDQVLEAMSAAAAGGAAMETKGFGSQAGSAAGSRKSSVVSGTTKQYLAELQTQCLDLQSQLEAETRRHEEQLRHNTVVMMEMQDTINELQRELSTLGKSAKKPRSGASSAHGVKTPSPDNSLMFTRLDMERNAKIMKKAVMEQRLDADKYKEVVTTMDDYVNLPAQRLAHLVKKYVHHSRMKEIEENVKKSESLDEQVFDALDKMEALQNQRARQWADKMDVMGLERLRLAAMLMDSLDSIEQESGLFLIKPMYSFKGRELKAPPTQKLARPARPQPAMRHHSAANMSTASFVPAPTPASHARRTTTQTPTHQMTVEIMSYPPPPQSRPEDGVMGSRAIRNQQMSQHLAQFADSFPTWNIQASQAGLLPENGQHLLNTPRMLELDINRMLIGQNNISTKLPYPPTDDRLVNASNNNLRSYITIQRPTASVTQDRPQSAHDETKTGTRASSPRPHVPIPVSTVDRDVPSSMASPPPLPPIGDRGGSAGSRSSNDETEQVRGAAPGELMTMVKSPTQVSASSSISSNY